MDQPPGINDDGVGSDDERGSNATDDQECDDESDDADPNYDANSLTWAPHTFGLKEFPLTRNEGLSVPNPGDRPIDFFSF